MDRYYWKNRTLCDVLRDMRRCNRNRNYAPLKSLINEVQIMGNRMEAGLIDIADLSKLAEAQSEARKELRALNKKVKAAKEELEALTGEE